MQFVYISKHFNALPELLFRFYVDRFLVSVAIINCDIAGMEKNINFI